MRLVGRVVAIAGRYARLPDAPPDAVIHLVHGKEDAVVPARHSVEAATRLVALGGDVTADIVPGITHTPHPELVDRALGHLQTFLPRRVWAEAIAEAPLMVYARRQPGSRQADRAAGSERQRVNKNATSRFGVPVARRRRGRTCML